VVSRSEHEPGHWVQLREEGEERGNSVGVPLRFCDGQTDSRWMAAIQALMREKQGGAGQPKLVKTICEGGSTDVGEQLKKEEDDVVQRRQSK
jgi:hypothetical protein